jgi:tetratricopeptide (TPR) repeat protein
MTSSRTIHAAAFALAICVSAGAARADDATELEYAKNQYDAGRYAEGVARFKDILNPASPNALKSPTAIERARAYYAACLIALGRNDEATDQIEKLLRANPSYRPDPVALPDEVIKRFLDVRAKLKKEIEAAERARAEARTKAENEQHEYILGLQRLASQETVVVRHSRWIAAIPFGVGQFQNGQEGMGYAFLVSESLLAGTSIAAGAIHMQLVSDYARAPTAVDFENFVSRKNTMRDLSVYSTSILAVLALGGILQAELAFVPEVREVRSRPLPTPPPMLPTVGAVDSGFVLGVFGKF